MPRKNLSEYERQMDIEPIVNVADMGPSNAGDQPTPSMIQETVILPELHSGLSESNQPARRRRKNASNKHTSNTSTTSIDTESFDLLPVQDSQTSM